MASLDTVSIAILLGALLVLAGILSSLIALRFGAPLLLVFLLLGEASIAEDLQIDKSSADGDAPKKKNCTEEVNARGFFESGHG